jgi:hypothetical protein
MRLLIKFIGSCFLVATFIWMFYLLNTTINEAFFVSGYQFGQAGCQTSWNRGISPDATSVYP